MYKELLGRLFLVVCLFFSSGVFMACDHLEVMSIVNPKFLYLKPQGPSLFYQLRQPTLLILSYWCSANNASAPFLVSHPPQLFSSRPLFALAFKLLHLRNLGEVLQRRNKPSDSWNSTSSPPFQLLYRPVPLGLIKRESSKWFPIQNITLHAVPSSLTRNPILLL